MRDVARLENGDRLPTVSASDADGGTMSVPDDLLGDPSLVVFYRGHF